MQTQGSGKRMATKRHLLLLVFLWANADCAVAGTDETIWRYLSLPLASKGG
jgi:DNA-binding LytR/AlgR family response regulator